MKLYRISVTILMLLVANAEAKSATRYDSFASWESAVGVFDLEDLESTTLGEISCLEVGPVGICPREIVIDARLLDIVIPAGADVGVGPVGVVEPGLVDGTREYSADLHSGVLVDGISFNTIVFPQPVSAFSVELARVEDFDGAFNPVAFPLSVDVAGESFEVAFGATFFGVTSATPFSSVVIRSTDAFQGQAVHPSLDNFRFQVVPEPSSALFMLLGLTVLTRSRIGASRSA